MYERHETGKIGEDIATKYLEQIGYEIIQRNFECKIGEIDIIAKDKNEIVFVEVKTRKNNTFGTPFEAITKTKYENIKKGALKYISENPCRNYRIDVIGITLQPELKIEHMQNI